MGHWRAQRATRLCTERKPSPCAGAHREGIRLVDHYAFAAAVKAASKSEPLRLKTDGEGWWKRYCVKGSIKATERELSAA